MKPMDLKHFFIILFALILPFLPFSLGFLPQMFVCDKTDFWGVIPIVFILFVVLVCYFGLIWKQVFWRNISGIFKPCVFIVYTMYVIIICYMSLSIELVGGMDYCYQ